MKNQWISIENEKPPEGLRVLFYSSQRECIFIGVRREKKESPEVYYIHHSDIYYTDCLSETTLPLYWMYLPQEPGR